MSRRLILSMLVCQESKDWNYRFKLKDRRCFLHDKNPYKVEIPAQRVLRSLHPQYGKLIRNFCTSKKCRKYKKCKNAKKRKKGKKNKKNKKCKKKIKAKKYIVAGVVVVVNLVLFLQIFFHAKSGGCSLKIDQVMANLVQLKKREIHTDTLTDFTVI